MAEWAPAVFFALLIPLLIILFVVYLRGKTFYRLVYILSVFTYAMLVMYIIDAYDLGRNAVIGLLVLSSLFMIFVGRHMSRVKRRKSNQQLLVSASCIIAILVLVGLCAAPLGFSVTKETVSIIPQASLDGTTPTLIHTVTVKNSFLPRAYELPKPTLCLVGDRIESGPVTWKDVERSLEGQYLEMGYETEQARLYLQAHGGPRPVKLDPDYQRNFTHALLYLTDEWIDCWSLTEKEQAEGMRIQLT